MTKNGYGHIIDFKKDILPHINFTDNNEKTFITEYLDYLVNIIIDEFGQYDVVISGSLAMFLYGIRLREHQDQSDINVFLLSDTLKSNDKENKYKEKYKYWLFEQSNIPIKLDVLTQKIFTRNFFSYNTFCINDTLVYVENPESLLHYEKLSFERGLGKEKYLKDIEIIQNYIDSKNDNECIILINTLNNIFNKINVKYAIVGSYSLWIQGIKLDREFGYDIDIVILDDNKEQILEKLNNDEFKQILYKFGIYKEIDFVDKHPIIDTQFNKVNFKGYEVYVSSVQSFIQTKLRYLYEKKTKSSEIKSKFDLECLSNLMDFNLLVIDYDLINLTNQMLTKINDIELIQNNEFYKTIKQLLENLLNILQNKINNDDFRTRNS